MENNRKLFEKLREEIISGKITCDDVIKRLTSSIEAEYLKETPNIDFINACEDFLWEIGTEGKQSFVSSTPQYLNAVQEACKQKHRLLPTLNLTKRLTGIAAVFLLVIIITQGAVRFHWFTQESNPDGEVFIIQGHTITVELIQSALANHTTSTELKTQDWAELCDYLGFVPSIASPDALQAHSMTYKAYIVPGLIIVDALYHDANGDSSAVMKVEYYLDPEEAYLMLQQDTHGDYMSINNHVIYLNTNMGHSSFTWLSDSTLTYLSGSFDHSVGMRIVEQLTKECE